MQNLPHEVLALMLTLLRVSCDSRMLSIFCEAMNVVARPVTFRLLEAGEQSLGETLEIRTASHRFGCLAVEGDLTVLHGESFAAIRNAVAMLAVLLDRQRHIQLLVEENVQALREREESMADIQRVAGIGQWEWDLRSDAVQHSFQARANLGTEEPEITFRGFLDRVHPADRKTVESAVRASVEEGVPYQCSFRVLRPDGRERFLMAWGEVIRDAAGVPVRMRGVAQDVTQRRSLEEQLMQAQKMEAIGRLAGGVAHDFNNLLTVINGYSQLLLGKLSAGDPLRAGLQEIHDAGARAEGLTRQLLAFSRKQLLQPRVLDLNHVVCNMRSMLARLMGEDVEVRVELDARAGMVRTDPHQLEQVVMNLAVNARDAMPYGGELLIETAGVESDDSFARTHPEARAERYVVLAVADTGAGMDEETQRHIFEPFFTTKGAGKGTGLGLSMVQGIVAQSGGFIEVYSEPGHGTTFKIYLPKAQEGAVADAGIPKAAPAQGGKETVLVVEDQPQVREYAATALKAYGHRVIKAENAGEALLICERERIDLVLTDVVMPNVSGRELARRLEKLRPGIKVLFMSGYTDDVIVQHGVLDESAEFIEKPFSPERLAARVRAVLGPAKRLGRILVANNEAGVRGFVRKVLEQAGYEVTEAADGKQALRGALAGPVDLVITDLSMPESEAIKTIQILRGEMPGIRIIALSGASGGPDRETAQTLRADVVLGKPLRPEVLLTKVGEVLGRCD